VILAGAKMLNYINIIGYGAWYPQKRKSKLSFEFRPLKNIPFGSLIDGRLEKYGIRVGNGGSRALLTGPDGCTLIATREGASTGPELSGNQTIVCECCGYNNIVEMPLSADLKTPFRCSECCHRQSVCQTDLSACAEFPDFSVKAGEGDT
jgi:hypothetical protein